jgi:hypothetical protein
MHKKAELLNSKKFVIHFWPHFKEIKMLNNFNPCEHRATIVAPAYLKSSKKDKKLDRGIFYKYIIKNLDSVSRK